MPLFEYDCPKCKKTVEILVRSRSEKPSCPDCGTSKLEKQLSVAAAPAISGNSLPVCGTHQPETCSRPQCGSGGCMFGG